MSNAKISIIIPAYKEADKVVKRVESLIDAPDVQLIVALAEGDSMTEEPTHPDALIVRAQAGRASQMNMGASYARGDILLFLHADTSIDPVSLNNVRDALKHPGVVGGAYRFAINAKGFLFRLISFMVYLRSKIFKAPYGDQALFVDRKVFVEIGGFRAMPIMEDTALVEAMRSRGEIVILDDRAVTSSRRWIEDGVCYTTARNWAIMLAYKLGIKPEKLVRWYRRR